MKKLRLDVESLEVEAFPTTDEEDVLKGTVFANSLNVNCGHTPDQACEYSEYTVCITFSNCPYYCDPTYSCDTAMDCVPLTT